jgi:cardiolipin synthase
MFDWTPPGWVGIAVIGAEWAIRIGLTPVVIRNREAHASLAWLAFIYFIPWIGGLFYLFLGEVDLGKRRSDRHERASRELRDKLDLHYPDATLNPEIPYAQRDLERLCRRTGGSRALAGNSARPITDMDEYVGALVEDIDAAESSVHVIFYIWGCDDTAQRVNDALVRAAERGVKVRALADAVGSKKMLQRTRRRLQKAGVEVAACLPVSPFRRAFARVDLRNHRKLIVVDGKVAYVGSHNLIDPHYGSKTYGPWHDLSARITGPAVTELQALYAEDWNAETGELLLDDELYPRLEHTGETPIQVAPSGPSGRPEAFRWLAVAALHEAEERVVMTSPYMALDESALRALQLTAMRGVDVVIVLPEKSNHPLVQAACRAQYETLLEAGVDIRLHQEGLLHAKTMTIDDAFVLAGSGNFDMRSFLLNFELNTILYGPEAAGLVRREQELYLEKSRQLTLEEWRSRPRWRRTVDRLAMLASPLL